MKTFIKVLAAVVISFVALNLTSCGDKNAVTAATMQDAFEQDIRVCARVMDEVGAYAAAAYLEERADQMYKWSVKDKSLASDELITEEQVLLVERLIKALGNVKAHAPRDSSDIDRAVVKYGKATESFAARCDRYHNN